MADDESYETLTERGSGAFWKMLQDGLERPEFRRHYLLERERMATIDRLINQLDEAREALGVTKADLARTIERKPETIRRLMTASSQNPQLGMVAEIAAALGYRLELVPMSAAEKKQVAEPLRELADA